MLRLPPPPRAAGKLFPANLDEENPSAPISSGLLVQADEGIPSPVVDLIDDIYRRLPSLNFQNRKQRKFNVTSATRRRAWRCPIFTAGRTSARDPFALVTHGARRGSALAALGRATRERAGGAWSRDEEARWPHLVAQAMRRCPLHCADDGRPEIARWPHDCRFLVDDGQRWSRRCTPLDARKVAR
ncbi:hypothetical protein F511_41668 [Dorcoceras hygrometricum]|uniref:Uncharacterized protein n=1 Tax=Dorcoceras hygrometricum TaxID=472368 RepID=A0A2Z7CLG2_9LAMI|nr:hypothetical protein F511_41668 [Dorcoceras hygrometricum]